MKYQKVVYEDNEYVLLGFGHWMEGSYDSSNGSETAILMKDDGTVFSICITEIIIKDHKAIWNDR